MRLYICYKICSTVYLLYKPDTIKWAAYYIMLSNYDVDENVK